MSFMIFKGPDSKKAGRAPPPQLQKALVGARAVPQCMEVEGDSIAGTGTQISRCVRLVVVMCMPGPSGPQGPEYHRM